tara:strand:+ start:684 stop:1523 length:840 start_codon:yes stop_codon:yes gene_type:complete
MDENNTSCHPILLASELYADILNSTSMTNHMMKLLKGVKNIKIVPYCYFHNDRMDYEEKKGKFYSNEEPASISYAVEEVELSDINDIVSYVVPLYRTKIPKNLKNTRLCGMIGVPIPNEEEPDINQDHYVTYIYENGTLMYFDSAITNKYSGDETYNILISVFNPEKTIVNKKTFETAGGVSESEYTYIAQNIFCHSWSLWFLYNILVNEKDMSSINRMAPRAKGDKYDRATLIKIKTFVFNILLDKLNLLYIKDINLFDSFKFIIENNNPNKYIKIIS